MSRLRFKPPLSHLRDEHHIHDDIAAKMIVQCALNRVHCFGITVLTGYRFETYCVCLFPFIF